MDKIFRRSTQVRKGIVRQKNEKNRKRNVILNFRVSPWEKELIEKRIELSGLPKAEYFIESCLYQAILVKGNVRTFDAIRDSIAQINRHVREMPMEKFSGEELETLRMILEILDRVYREGA